MVDERSEAGGGAGPGAGLRGRDLIGLGGLLAGSVVLGLVVGLLVDRAAGSAPIGVLIGIGLGVLAGCVGFVAKVRAALRG
ncbi:AtpZ/AtpI family protein [Nocardioides sp. YIM 152315]|uniref:AtpZ/AtpI family protein n=1 Tax=Nocardioides sp. YIM 152315 TaxID=3031760 RepID=UPI0023DB1228|nr:AtpZ/AtpI family protein [Nocardioides sp. YIM 152315]MDF1603757.1 AtpZ/AtpI family protein [Nocardioides sp. YIM 152315]